MGYPLFQNHEWNDQKCSVKIGFVCQTNNHIEGKISLFSRSTGIHIKIQKEYNMLVFSGNPENVQWKIVPPSPSSK